MTLKLIVGPLLGVEGDSEYTVCFLTPLDVQKAQVNLDGKTFDAEKVRDLPHGTFWRTSLQVKIPEGRGSGRVAEYQVLLEGAIVADVHCRTEWHFYIPAENERHKFAYASCNGVSKADKITKLDEPFALWRQMSELHKEEPFSMLIMGGDQIYADSIWDKVSSLDDWSSLKFEEQVVRKSTKKMMKQLDDFYSRLYKQRWSNEHMSLMLASVPNVMMWDDHDIFDGWGSFPRDLQNSEVFSEIFRHAKKYFELFQIRTLKNRTLLSIDGDHYAFGFTFRGSSILALDNRSERSIRRVMSDAQWGDVMNYLDRTKQGSLFVMSAVPVVYRDFSFTESAMDLTPWHEDLEDDLKDHWRAKEHQGERNRLIMNLLDNAGLRQQKDGSSKTVFLSGDVHVGCLGVVTDSRNERLVKLHQVVSSGIVHPAPSLIQWLGIAAVTNDDVEPINEESTIEARMLTPVGSKRYIRKRNFVTVKEGTDDKLWVNWITEDMCRGETFDQPLYPIASSPDASKR